MSTSQVPQPIVFHPAKPEVPPPCEGNCESCKNKQEAEKVKEAQT